MDCLGRDLFNFESYTENGIFPGESAVGAGIDAFVREIKWSKHAHRAAEVTSGDGGGFAGKQLEFGIGTRREESIESLQDRRPVFNPVQ